jgi:hypothetical protein
MRAATLMKIKRFRLSYIWTAVIPELIEAAVPAPLGDLVEQSKYAAIFNTLLAGGGNPVVELPWPRRSRSTLPERNNYWTDAVVGSFSSDRNADRGRLAWKASVQFRHRDDGHKDELLSVDLADRCFGEGWYFPTGVGVSLTVWISGEFDGNQFKQKVSDFTGGKLPVTVGGVKSTDIIDRAAGKAIDILRAKGFGLPPVTLSEKPIRILTVIAADHDPNETNKPAAEAAMLQDVLIAGGGTPAVSIKPDKNIYALPHSRVIWRPDCFLSKQTGLHTLGCLHRNITMATLHAASVIKAAEATTAVIDNLANVPTRISGYAYAIGELLRKMNNASEKYVYKQQCLRDQIAEAKTMINRLRAQCLQPPL